MPPVRVFPRCHLKPDSKQNRHKVGLASMSILILDGAKWIFSIGLVAPRLRDKETIPNPKSQGPGGGFGYAPNAGKPLRIQKMCRVDWKAMIMRV